MMESERINELEIKLYELECINEKLDRENHCIKNKLVNANNEITKLRKIIEKKNKQLSSRRKERYKNNKR